MRSVIFFLIAICIESVISCQLTPVKTSHEGEEKDILSIETGKTVDKTTQEEYVPSREEYDKAFYEIEDVIKTLNSIIHKRDYKKWLTFLTDNYIAEKSDFYYLKEVSEKPIIKNQNIVIQNLEDYFYYVVVPSRLNAQLYKIAFIDDIHVKAYTYIENENEYVILYYLEKQNDTWKIGSW